MSTYVFRFHYHSTSAQYSYSSRRCYFLKDEWAKPGKPPTEVMLLRKSRSIKKYKERKTHSTILRTSNVP